MKALRIHQDPSGSTSLILEETPQPQPAAGELLVKVQAAGVTRTEPGWSTNWTSPNGGRRANPIPGHEFSGIVTGAGPRASTQLVGKTVVALTDFHRDGAQAEFCTALPGDLAPAPPGLELEKAAALPLSALTAWQALYDYGKLTFNHVVLVHGGAGGVGSLAIQLAHNTGAYVIATAAMRDLSFVRSLGAQEAIPYHLARFEKIVHHVDIVLDTVGGETQERSWQVLKKGGILISVVSAPSPERAERRQARAAYFIVHPDGAQLAKIGDLIQRGRIQPVLDSVYPLEQASQAYDHARSGHPRGKVVLQIT